MKSRHVGFLIVGVALAVGLAVKMTQAPPLPPVAQVPRTERMATLSPVVPAPAAKTSPIPQAQTPAPARAAAPQAEYDDQQKPVTRKFKPFAAASLTKAKPTQWTPGPYQKPSGAILAKPQATATARIEQPPAQPADQPDPQPADQPVEQKAAPEPTPPTPQPPAASAPRHVTLRAGMAIPVRLDQPLMSGRTNAGDTFAASLAEPFTVDGLIIAEKGARVIGRIVNSENARLQLELANLSTSDGQRINISTDPWTRPFGAGEGMVPGTLIRFRLATRVTVTEQQVAGR
jgi:hypothetical protein